MQLSYLGLSKVILGNVGLTEVTIDKVGCGAISIFPVYNTVKSNIESAY